MGIGQSKDNTSTDIGILFSGGEDEHLSHEEKYEAIFAFKKKSETEIIQMLKENCRLLTCPFLFETFSLREREEDTECNCSRELELCYRKGVDKDEMIRQLENAINTGSCPHLLCYYEATENTPEPDITSLKLTEACDATIKNQRAGIFWIHLAVIYHKSEVIRQIMPLVVKSNLRGKCVQTFKHRFSSAHIAVLQKHFDLVSLIATYDLDSFLLPRCSHISGQCNAENALTSMLTMNEYEVFSNIYNKFLARAKCFPYGTICSIWADKIIDSMNKCDRNSADVLLSVKIGVDGHICLVQKMLIKDCLLFTRHVCSKINLRQTVKHSSKEQRKRFNELMICAVFSDKPGVVQLLLENGLNTNIEFGSIKLLAWSKALQYQNVTTILRNSRWLFTNAEQPCFYTLLTELVRASAALAENTLPYKILATHRLFEIDYNLCLKSLKEILHENSYYQCDILHYLILRGFDPFGVDVLRSIFMCEKSNLIVKTFLFHIITTNSFLDVTCLFKAHIKLNYRQFGTFSYSKGINLIVNLSNCEKTNIINGPIKVSFCGRPDEDIIDNFVSCFNDNICQPQTLVSLSRRSLRVNFPGIYYYRYLNKMQDKLPTSVYDYLLMTDLLIELFRNNQGYLKILHRKTKLARQLLGVGQYKSN